MLTFNVSLLQTFYRRPTKATSRRWLRFGDLPTEYDAIDSEGEGSQSDDDGEGDQDDTL